MGEGRLEGNTEKALGTIGSMVTAYVGAAVSAEVLKSEGKTDPILSRKAAIITTILSTALLAFNTDAAVGSIDPLSQNSRLTHSLA